jgi:hypothetical protein
MANLQGPRKKDPPVNVTKRAQRQDDLAPIHEGKGRSAGGYTVGNVTDPARFDKTPANRVRGEHATRHAGHTAGQGDGARKPVADRTDPASIGYPANVVNQMMLNHLQQIGQTPGPQPRTSLQQMPPDLGLAAGGLHEPGAMGQGAGGQPGAGPGGPGGASGNPIAPFLAQVLNPRAAATSPQGAVPTLPGAPQGFDLYHMMQLLHLFRSLYGSLPVGGSSAGLPTGVPGPGY